jgi:peptidoglycan lytic transglycosylase D
MAAYGDSLVPPVVEPLPSQQIGAADAEVLEDLAVGSPDDVLVPAFDASGVRWDIDVRTYAEHPRVQYYLRYFQGPARERMAVFLERGSRFEPMIRRRFEAEGLPGDLGYLALIESGYSSEAVSRSRAVGMWQFMRGTGRGYGLRVDTWVDERRDPVKATDAAARHLRDLRERFGSLYLAAAAYNAGAGKVSRSLGKLQWEPAPEPAADTVTDAVDDSTDAAEDVADSLADAAADAADSADATDELPGVTSDAAFFRLAESDLLAAETRDYVPKLIAAALIAKQPARYGFAPAAAAPFGYDSLLVSDATGLDVVARLAGTSLTEIRALNPQYLRLATPPRTHAVVRVPVGTGEDVARGYAATPASQRVHFLTHVVRKRERLSTIAARYRLASADLRAANPRVKSSRPAAGTRLVIPTVAIPSALAVQAAGSSRPHASASRTHRVRRGETLTGIAHRYRVSIPALRRANALRQDNMLRAGMRLRIPG